MFKNLLLIGFSCLVISGCASFNYESRPFFSRYGGKVDCSQNLDGSIFRVRSERLCFFELAGY